jgi:hypothetical protein
MANLADAVVQALTDCPIDSSGEILCDVNTWRVWIFRTW